MNISPISFGRAIKMKGPIEVAQKLKNAVNSKQYSQNGKILKEFGIPIFYDANISGGGVEVYPVSQNISYLFSGEDAKKAREINQSTLYYYRKNLEDAERSAKNSQEKEKYLNIARAENEKLVAQRNEKFESMLENGTNVPRNSFIMVDSYYIDEENMQEKIAIRYDSCSDHINEIRSVYI